MQKVLFIDRDGTLCVEPPITEQVDSFEVLEFLPKVFQYLAKIAQELDFKLVMITNQDGLGTDSFPENTFWNVHDFIVKTFENEGITFEDIYIDKTFAHENAPTRKPNTGLLGKYIEGDYDLENSFVIGDRLSDVELAKNLGGKGILISDNPNVETGDLAEFCGLIAADWKAIYEYLKLKDRTAEIRRTTKETDIFIKINLDGKGVGDCSTGLAFFDHMLDQIARHSGIDLTVKVDGDLEVDEHHTIEDTAIALGEVFHTALGSKRGIERYGFCLPMDDCLAQVALDFGGRNWLVWKAKFKREKIGDLPTEMFFHFFKSFTDAAKCNLNIKAKGKNEHHKIEAIFKAFAKAIKMAIKRDVNSDILPTTKGVL